MKVAISATGATMDAPFDVRFGRCSHLIIVDTETREWKAVRNGAAQASSGAGIQAAQTVANEGAEAVITGHLGPNAFRVLAAARIRPLVTVAGSVRQALEAFEAGQVTEIASPNSPGHAGGPPHGQGHGFGGGRRC